MTIVPRPGGPERALVALVVVLALVAATYPAWRVLLLGSKPTIDELLRLRCSAPRQAAVPAPRGTNTPWPPSRVPAS